MGRYVYVKSRPRLYPPLGYTEEDEVARNGKMRLLREKKSQCLMVFHEKKGMASLNGLLDGVEWEDWTFPTDTEHNIMSNWQARHDR